MHKVFSSVFNSVMKNAQAHNDPVRALERVCELYQQSVNALETYAKDFLHFRSSCEVTDVTYPYVGIKVNQKASKEGLSPGAYGITLTHPHILYEYYLRKLSDLILNNSEFIWVGESYYSMSLPFVNEALFNMLPLEEKRSPEYFHMPCISRIQDKIAKLHKNCKIQALDMFHGERIGYSLNRLHHYCGTSAEFFQNNIIFVNYEMYTRYFIQMAEKLVKNGEFDDLIYYKRGTGQNFDPQMPAYHLTLPNRNGITLINIGVGPSNAKTITDHLAVLQAKSWVMLGHCAGLKAEHSIGDYILARNYARYDHVLDNYIPVSTPIPVSEELFDSFEKSVSDYNNGNLSQKMHFGTIVTTDDRHWELNGEMVNNFCNTQSIAVDMESGTIATNAFRFGIPSMSFLCISDIPLHGEIKLQKMAADFYRTKIKNHFEICIEAVMKHTSKRSIVEKVG